MRRALGDWFAEANKMVLAAGAVVFLVLVIGLLVVVRGGGGQPADGSGEESPLLAETGTGVVDDESVIAERVAATMEAMQPAPTVTPTPDIAATLQAELFANRMDRLVLSPLDRRGERNPYLNEDELEYLTGLGDRLWVYTKVWLHVRELLSVDPVKWTLEFVEGEVRQASALLGSVTERRSPSSAEVGEVVLVYGQTIEEGMSEVGQAVTLLEEAVRVLGEADEGEPLSAGGRQSLTVIVRAVEDGMDGFDRAMSSYGCSICGELFRHRRGN